MYKSKTRYRQQVIFSVFGAAMMVGAVPSMAAPGCMSSPQYMSPAYYPAGPMAPRAGYRSGPPMAYRGWQAPHMDPYSSGMPSPYPLPAAARNGGAYPAAGSPGPAWYNTASAGLASSAPGAAASPADDSVVVQISGMRFEPANITVKSGTTVTWVNSSGMPHTTTGTEGELRSGTLYNGQQYSYTFDSAGRHVYACDFHPSMQGVVTVESPSEDS